MSELELKSTIFDRPRRLIINNEYISFDNRSSVGLEPTVFQKKEIKGIRYGVRLIRGVYFYIGRIYCIDILNTNREIIRIRLKSIYQIRNKRLTEKYLSIVNSLLEFYFIDLAITLINQFNDGHTIELLGVEFSTAGVKLDAKQKHPLISWDDLKTGSYSSYYVLSSKSDPNNYRHFEWMHHWNTATLYSVSRTILRQKGLMPKG